jgi:predicted lipid-binding transport protein (Tim44 family)
MKRGAVLAAMLFVLFASSQALARGGGGCLAKGTPILTPSGHVAIERLRAGDTVWSISGGKVQTGTVQVLSDVHTDHYLEIAAGEEKILITSEHPVMVGPGEYRMARLLKAGENVYRVRNGSLRSVPVTSVRHIPSNQPAYNLLVIPGGTFMPAGIVVHNKGCFLPDSEILKSDGTKKLISAVLPGDELLAYSPDGSIVHTKVKNILHHKVKEYLLLKTDRHALKVTAEHPFYVGQGTFKTLDALKIGDAIFAWDGQSLSEQRIISMERVHEQVLVFNLQTDHPNTFFASGIAVHNKGGGGGCFPAGTMIRTPSGQAPVESLSIHDKVRAVDAEGHIINSSVEKLFTTLTHVLLVKTNRGALRTTIDHPVGLPDGTFLEAGSLRSGNDVLVWDKGALIPATVLGTSISEGKELVYNLSVGQPHNFLAADFLVHNKGGSSSRSSSSSSTSRGGSSDDMSGIIVFVIFFSLFIVIVVIIQRKRLKSSKSENLDYTYNQAEVGKKAKKTEKLLVFLSRQDPSVSTKELHTLAESTFRKLQECWQKRDFGPMQPLLMPDLFRQHSAQLQGLVRNHEINRIDDLKVERIDLVNVRYTNKPDQREFTAFVTASARDYYLDDRTSRFLRGDKSPARFQEFWTFHLSGDHWLLREIEQAGESDILKDENFVEMLTDQTIKGIYEEAAAKEGKAGPWVEKATEEKATRIDRLLNFLVQTDKIWDRSQMMERARQIFLNLFLARESGDPAQLPQADMFPNIADSLRKQIQQWQMEGRTLEYRNICVRKAELILVRNYADPVKDEFTVRMSAHAQKIERKGQMVLSEQQYVTPFEEYWTFGRLDKVWKLKEVLPPALGEKLMTEENVDEDSSAGQMQWYYREKRAV